MPASRTQRGVFITVEGPDGSGKTTQVELLAAYLRARGADGVLTREPGGTPVGESIRALLLAPRHAGRLAGATERRLFAACRAQHVRERIEPALARGSVVVASRYIDATVAYQAYGRGLPLDFVGQVNAFATGGLKPDLPFVLDIETEEGLRRARNVHKETPEGEADRIEGAGLAFHRRVREGYLAVARAEPDRCIVIACEGPIERIARRIAACVHERFPFL